MRINRKGIIWVLVFFFVFMSLSGSITALAETGTEEPAASPVESFVMRLYTIALNREAEETGLEFWAKGLTEQKYTAAQVVNFILLESPEFLNKGYSDSEFVDISYRTFFNRPADPSGKDYWEGMLSEGYSRRWVIANMLNASEFKALCSDAGISAGKLGLTKADYPSPEFKTSNIVKRLYTVALRREAEKEGLDFWTKGLLAGKYTAAQVVNFILLESPEFLNKGYSDQEFVDISYLTFFNRTPDSGGRDYWIGRLNAGYTRRWVIANMLSAPTAEFDKLCTAAGIKTGKLGIKSDDLPNSKGNTAGNINNIGFVAAQGDWIYYSYLGFNEKTLGEDFAHLYKARKNGTETVKLTNEGATFINVIGEWIYYVQNDEPNWIYKMKTDGTEREVVLEEPALNLTVTKSYIYFISPNDFCLYRMKHDGSERMVLTSQTVSYNVIDDNNIIFSDATDDFALCKIAINGQDMRITRVDNPKSSVNAEYFDVSGDWIYFADAYDNYRVCKVKKDGTEKTKLTDYNSFTIMVIGDWVYFDHGDQPFKMKKDGSQLQQVIKEDIGDIYMWYYNIIGDDIYFTNTDSDITFFDMLKVKTNGNGVTLVQPY